MTEYFSELLASTPKRHLTGPGQRLRGLVLVVVEVLQQLLLEGPQQVGVGAHAADGPDDRVPVEARQVVEEDHDTVGVLPGLVAGVVRRAPEAAREVAVVPHDLGARVEVLAADVALSGRTGTRPCPARS
jgi:hypothetical protein